MSTIRIIYTEEPRFPATDQHPDAVRYKIGDYWVDAIGGEPRQEDVDATLNPPVTEPRVPRDALAEIDALKGALVAKSVISNADISAALQAVRLPAMDAAPALDPSPARRETVPAGE